MYHQVDRFPIGAGGRGRLPAQGGEGVPPGQPNNTRQSNTQTMSVHSRTTNPSVPCVKKCYLPRWESDARPNPLNPFPYQPLLEGSTRPTTSDNPVHPTVRDSILRPHDDNDLATAGQRTERADTQRGIPKNRGHGRWDRGLPCRQRHYHPGPCRRCNDTVRSYQYVDTAPGHTMNTTKQDTRTRTNNKHGMTAGQADTYTHTRSSSHSIPMHWSIRNSTSSLLAPPTHQHPEMPTTHTTAIHQSVLVQVLVYM